MQVWIFYGALKLSIGAIWAPFRNRDSAEGCSSEPADASGALLHVLFESLLCPSWHLCGLACACVCVGKRVAFTWHSWRVGGIRAFWPETTVDFVWGSYMQLGIRLPHVSLI